MEWGGERRKKERSADGDGDGRALEARQECHLSLAFLALPAIQQSQTNNRPREEQDPTLSLLCNIVTKGTSLDFLPVRGGLVCYFTDQERQKTKEEQSESEQ
jgi:hypothetical protein